MSNITNESTLAFMQDRPYRKSNTVVELGEDCTKLLLHGNLIAIRKNDARRTLLITSAGWKSKTTKSRLNALPNVDIQTKAGKWHLNGKQWDGGLADVTNDIDYMLSFIQKIF